MRIPTDRERCTATARSGERCKRWPIKGAKTCAMHGSATKRARAAAKARREREVAERAVATYGLPRVVDPDVALLEEVHRTAGHVAWLQAVVREIESEHLVWGVTKKKTGGDDYGTTEESKPNAWLELYREERKHLVAVCRDALKAGIEERRVKLAEDQGALLVTVIRSILDDLNLDAVQQALVGEVVPRHLRAIEAA